MFAQCSAAIKRALTIISILHAPSRHIITACPLPCAPDLLQPWHCGNNHSHGHLPPSSLLFFQSQSPLPCRQGSPLWASPSQIWISIRAHTVGSRVCSNQCLFLPAHPSLPGHISQLHAVRMAGELLPCEYCLLTRNFPSWGTLLPLIRNSPHPREAPAAKGRLAGTENWWPREGK